MAPRYLIFCDGFDLSLHVMAASPCMRDCTDCAADVCDRFRSHVIRSGRDNTVYGVRGFVVRQNACAFQSAHQHWELVNNFLARWVKAAVRELTKLNLPALL